MRYIGKIDPSTQTSMPVGMPARSNLVLYNESMYMLKLTFARNETALLAPWCMDRFQILEETLSIDVMIEDSLGSLAPPISRLYGVLFEPSESVVGVYPAAVSRDVNIGNTVTTSNSQPQSIVALDGAAIATIISTVHQNTLPPAAGFGGQIDMHAETDVHTARTQVRIRMFWQVPTDGAQRARFQIEVWDTAARLALEAEASGTDPMIGFLGARGALRQAVPAASTDLASVIALTNALRLALNLFGLTT